MSLAALLETLGLHHWSFAQGLHTDQLHPGDSAPSVPKGACGTENDVSKGVKEL